MAANHPLQQPPAFTADQLLEQESAALLVAWREALEDPALDAPADHTLLARASAAIAAHPDISRHGVLGPHDVLDPNSRIHALHPQLLARVFDFINRMANNPLGVYYLRDSSIRYLRNLMDSHHGQSPLGNPAGDALLRKLMNACFGGNPVYSGDGYVSLALVMTGMVDAEAVGIWSSDYVLGPAIACAQGWEACGDCCWVAERLSAPWLQLPSVTRHVDGRSVCAAGSYVGTVLPDDAHHHVFPRSDISGHHVIT